jgi:general stress protein YciG
MENIFLNAFYSISYSLFVAHRLQPECWNTQARRNLVAKEDRGFASMDRSKQRDIASKGGKAAHQKGTAHEWTSEEAREAGRKGGMASHRRKQEQQEQQTPEGDPTDGNTPESTIGGTVNPEAMMGTDNLP